MSVTTSATHSITYKLYSNIVYVADPVLYQYESMNVFVPTSIDGTSVSTTSAPIVLDIGVGGYMSSSVWGSTTLSTNGQYALAAGYVVVAVGCRGRDNTDSSGSYVGKAPAAIVDLKAAVRFIRYNSGSFPGNVDRIVSTGGSAGGALSMLLGASGNSSLYDSYLTALGAASADDNIYAAAGYSPITDLDHADMAYEWEFGSVAYSSATVDQTVSGTLQTLFKTYENGLGMTGRDSFGTITADNIKNYVLTEFLVPSANKYIAALSSSSRTTYLSTNSWITWDSSTSTASFSYSDYASYVGRSKALPAFDSFFDLSSSTFTGENLSTTAETVLFGDSTTNARHFTDFSLQYTTGSSSAAVSSSLQTIVNMMNPMYFISAGNSGAATYWFIRAGGKESDSSRMVFINLPTLLETKGKTVNAWLYWEGGHNVNEDPDAFISWIEGIK